ncbi:hypothetical protein GN244_ATG12586 [Phytophthora infestans]|uniref:Uncharacterized protein n=1 Tax=Phytophthora infestans TaxID=4787 RepID=A0A833WAA3_PHYIN|nr:hypothetical protein GN244_ATG12586 [Phytophthora infestans]
MFDMDASGFQKMIKKYVDMYEPFLYAHLVKEPEVLWSMKKITVTRPTGNFHEVMKYFSGKHKLYGHKVEVFGAPNRGNAEFHKSAMRKQQDEGVISDVGPGMDKFEGFWAVLVEKGYQGLGDEFRTIHPKKKARGQRALTPDE